MIFSIYLTIGFSYMLYLWATSPPEDRPPTTFVGYTQAAITAIGGSALWPVVLYINNFVERPKE
jgi:hypothetical protein